MAQSAVHLICDSSGYTQCIPHQHRAGRDGRGVWHKQYCGHLAAGSPQPSQGSGNNTKGLPRNLYQQLLGHMADITPFLQVACAEELELYPPQARGPAQAANASQLPRASF